MGEKVTIYQIAKEAGVSTATVSRVITGKANVKIEKKNRIEELIRQYNFQPNALAKSLRETKSHVIGMILIDFINPYYATLLSACEREARKQGYSLVVSGTLGNIDLEGHYLDEMHRQRVGAVIMIGGGVDEIAPNRQLVEHVNLISNNIPVITTGKLHGVDCYRVSLDEAMGMELVMEYLLSLGHREIAFLGGSRFVNQTVEKRSRYIEILQENHIPVKEAYIVEGGKRYDYQDGYECMEKLFQLDRLPTAVIAVNDFVAIGVIHAIMERGLRIPEDISVAAFDDTYIAKMYKPQLTSVSYNYDLLGQKIIKTAIRAIEGEESVDEGTISPKLMIRESCSAPLQRS